MFVSFFGLVLFDIRHWELDTFSKRYTMGTWTSWLLWWFEASKAFKGKLGQHIIVYVSFLQLRTCWTIFSKSKLWWTSCTKANVYPLREKRCKRPCQLWWISVHVDERWYIILKVSYFGIKSSLFEGVRGYSVVQEVASHWHHIPLVHTTEMWLSARSVKMYSIFKDAFLFFMIFSYGRLHLKSSE